MHSGKAGLPAVSTASTVTTAAAQTECSPAPTSPVQAREAAPGARGPAGPPAVSLAGQDREHASGEDTPMESWVKESCSLYRQNCNAGQRGNRADTENGGTNAEKCTDVSGH